MMLFTCMRTITFIAISVCLLLISSCKKCIECHNVCYDCGPTANIVCSDIATTQAQFNALIESIESTGRTCTVTTSTKSFDVCDKPSTVKNFQDYYEEQLYKCEDK